MARGPLHLTSMKKQSSKLHGSPMFSIDEETELWVTWVHYVQHQGRNRAPSCIIQPCANFCLTILLCTKCVYLWNTNISDVQLYLHQWCTLVSLYTLPWFRKQLYMYINIPVKHDNVHWLICEDWDTYVTQYPHCSKDCCNVVVSTKSGWPIPPPGMTELVVRWDLDGFPPLMEQSKPGQMSTGYFGVQLYSLYDQAEIWIQDYDQV